jgi:hypothetical protein
MKTSIAIFASLFLLSCSSAPAQDQKITVFITDFTETSGLIGPIRNAFMDTGRYQVQTLKNDPKLWILLCGGNVATWNETIAGHATLVVLVDGQVIGVALENYNMDRIDYHATVLVERIDGLLAATFR